MREAELDAELKTGLEPLLLAIDTIDLQIAKVEEKLAALCAQEPVVTLLATLPGVNTIIAATFVSVIDEAGRFRDAHQVESYLGLVPRETTSGGADKRRLGSITLKGNSYCRAMLVQAGWQVLRRKSTEGPLQAWAHAVSKRRGRKVATVATARRLAGILWAMWRDGTAYDPRLLNLHGARGLRISAQDLKDRAERLEQAAKKMTRRLNDSRRRKSRLTAEVTHPS